MYVNVATSDCKLPVHVLGELNAEVAKCATAGVWKRLAGCQHHSPADYRGDSRLPRLHGYSPADYRDDSRLPRLHGYSPVDNRVDRCHGYAVTRKVVDYRDDSRLLRLLGYSPVDYRVDHKAVQGDLRANVTHPTPVTQLFADRLAAERGLHDT